MTNEEAERDLRVAIRVTREDIARAKAWLVRISNGATHELVEKWLAENTATTPQNPKIDLTLDGCSDQVAAFGRSFGLRMAFYQAEWELIATSDLIPAGESTEWVPSVSYRSSGYSAGLNLKGICCYFPTRVMRPPLAPAIVGDTDIFLLGVGVASLHSGIREAVDQSLVCFRRGLYMPALAMLAAAAEATWTECGVAVARKLGNTKLESLITEQITGIGKIVLETRKALEHADAKSLLRSAEQTLGKVNDAEAWTTILRERRNALHWGKAQSFVADHSETADLLLGAPLHIGTLEKIRTCC